MIETWSQIVQQTAENTLISYCFSRIQEIQSLESLESLGTKSLGVSRLGLDPGLPGVSSLVDIPSASIVGGSACISVLPHILIFAIVLAIFLTNFD